MPPRAQQRTSRARYAPKRSVPPLIQVIPWTVAVITPDTMEVTLQAGSEGLSLTGIPAFKQLNSGELPTAAVLGGSTMQVVYADPIDPSSPIVLPSQDPALRGPQGEYLAPQQVPVTPAGPAIVVAPSVSPTDRVALNPTTPLNELVIGSYEGWETVPTGIVANYWYIDSSNWYLQFPADITGETGLRHTSGWTQNISLAGGRVPLQEWSFPV